jgi:CSLREA domain-containing protein
MKGLGSPRRSIAAAIAVASMLMLAPATAPAATINVTTNADVVANDMQCSLREAVTAANTNVMTDCTDGDGTILDTIQLAPTTTIYTLDKPPPFMGNNDNNADGDLDIEGGTAGVRIAGAGAGVTTITTTVMDRLIHVESGSATVEGVTVTGGAGGSASAGGGISNASSATLALNNSAVTSNIATGGGGGITNTGILTLTNTAVSGNDAASTGGGINQTGAGAATTLNGSTISGNDVGVDGGGIYLQAGMLTLNQSVVSDNNAAQTVDDMTNHSPRGGGLHLSGGTATIDGSSITGNDARTADPDNDTPFGGGIYSGANATITNSTLSGNTTIGGAGSSRQGGGIYNAGALTVRNSTISGNNAGGRGGGLRNSIAPAELVHVTFNGNTAGVGAAMDYEDLPMPGGSLRLRGVLIANGPAACSFAGVGAAITSDGYNIDQGSSCGLAGTGDLQNVANPMIGGLTTNGGPTMTHALLAGSPAIDRVPVADCDDENGAPLADDQRGFARPSPPGGPCDVGSFELTQNPASSPPPPASSPPPPLLPTTAPAVQAKISACAALRAKLKKAKSKKKKRKIRKQLRKLGC